MMKAKVVIDQATFSRSNPETVKVMSNMLSVMFKEEPYPTAKITIMTSYNAQKGLFLELIRDLQEMIGLPFDQLPRVATIDSMQGHESDIVILDWVNEYGKQLGFLKNNRHANVALTRAHASLIVLFHKDKSKSDDFGGWRRTKKPEILEHWDYLGGKDYIISVTN